MSLFSSLVLQLLLTDIPAATTAFAILRSLLSLLPKFPTHLFHHLLQPFGPSLPSQLHHLHANFSSASTLASTVSANSFPAHNFFNQPLTDQLLASTSPPASSHLPQPHARSAQLSQTRLQQPSHRRLSLSVFQQFVSACMLMHSSAQPRQFLLRPPSARGCLCFSVHGRFSALAKSRRCCHRRLAVPHQFLQFSSTPATASFCLLQQLLNLVPHRLPQVASCVRLLQVTVASLLASIVSSAFGFLSLGFLQAASHIPSSLPCSLSLSHIAYCNELKIFSLT